MKGVITDCNKRDCKDNEYICSGIQGRRICHKNYAISKKCPIINNKANEEINEQRNPRQDK